MPNPHPALAPVFKRFENFDLSVGSRGEFYEIRRCFVEAARGQGFLKTVHDAADLIEEAVSSAFWRDVACRHSDTFAALHQTARAAPHTFIDDAISCLLSGRVGDAVRNLGEIHGKRIDNFAKYRLLLDSGPDRGLAIWQVMNPFYYVWATLPAARAVVSDGWRSEQFDSPVGDVIEVTAEEVDENQRALITMSREELGAAFWANATVLECGCGDGRTADLLARHLDVPPNNYRGFDLQPGRRDATRRVLRALTGSGSELGQFNESSVFIFDALKAPTADQLEMLTGVDLLFSASFTNVFSDEQLAYVLNHLLVGRPTFVIDVSVVTSWGLCVGRADPAPFYGQHGYRLRASRMESPRLAGNESHRIWMPERYWSNRCIFLYERDSD
jgi:hypothetical protein